METKDFKTGQEVMFQGRQTHIEKVNDDSTFVIANPFWEWDDEDYCISIGEDYDMPYWITVDLSELSN
jgi:hypothetical protein